MPSSFSRLQFSSLLFFLISRASFGSGGSFGVCYSKRFFSHFFIYFDFAGKNLYRNKMAENAVDKKEVVPETEECPLKDKKIESANKEVESAEEKEDVADKKDEGDEETNKKVENGDVKEENGKQDTEEEKEDVCEKTASKRKSTGGGDAPDGTPAEATPDKKQKTEDAPKEEEPQAEEVVA